MDCEMTTTADAAASFDVWATRKSPKPVKNYAPAALIRKNTTQMLAKLAAKDWQKSRAGHLVAYYAHCHEAVYGVPPGELVGHQYNDACLAVARLAKKEFRGDLFAMVPFVRWVFKREEWMRSERAKRGEMSTFRYHYKAIFSSKPVTDYRVWIAQKDPDAR
jgi:hypothetical protein